jgi:hypothetical protein
MPVRDRGEAGPGRAEAGSCAFPTPPSPGPGGRAGRQGVEVIGRAAGDSARPAVGSVVREYWGEPKRAALAPRPADDGVRVSGVHLPVAQTDSDMPTDGSLKGGCTWQAVTSETRDSESERPRGHLELDHPHVSEPLIGLVPSQSCCAAAVTLRRMAVTLHVGPGPAGRTRSGGAGRESRVAVTIPHRLGI